MFHYFVRNSLIALLEAVCARIFFFRFVHTSFSWLFFSIFFYVPAILFPNTHFFYPQATKRAGGGSPLVLRHLPCSPTSKYPKEPDKHHCLSPTTCRVCPCLLRARAFWLYAHAQGVQHVGTFTPLALGPTSSLREECAERCGQFVIVHSSGCDVRLVAPTWARMLYLPSSFMCGVRNHCHWARGGENHLNVGLGGTIFLSG